jgi:Putative peptidoglycan binding domain
MSTNSTNSATGTTSDERMAHASPDGDGFPPRRGGRRWIAVIVIIAVVAAGVAIAVTRPFGHPASTGNGIDNGAPTALATVTQRSLSSQVSVDATLGYAGTYTVVNQATGTITWLPAVGATVRPGNALYRVDGAPVVLLSGSVPAYRSLFDGMTGADVRELNASLVALGYAKASALDPASNVFSSATVLALEKLQAHLGLQKTGSLPLGQAVFLPSAVRITAQALTAAAPAMPGTAILSASSTRREVVIQLDAAQQSEIRVGDKVLITLPDNSTTPGVVSFVGRVATSSSSSSSDRGSGSGSSPPTVEVDVRPLHPKATGHLDQAPVTVAITTASAANALVVPVTALLALSGGGYALEVVKPGGGRSLVPVTPGLFDDADGLVQVSGNDVSAGQRIVVPAI